jgi:hypothetical protein
MLLALAGVVPAASASADSALPLTQVKRIASGPDFTCALRTDNSVSCWGAAPRIPASAPKFKLLAAGNDTLCGITLADHVECYGGALAARAPGSGSYVDVVVGGGEVCAKDRDGRVDCRNPWEVVRGVDRGKALPWVMDGSRMRCAAPAGGGVDCLRTQTVINGTFDPESVPNPWRGQDWSLLESSAFSDYYCGRRDAPDGGWVRCYYDDPGWPGGRSGFYGSRRDPGYGDLTVGGEHACGLLGDGRVECWTLFGSSADAAAAVPAGVRFTAISAGAAHTCGITTAGDVRCWGSNSQGQLDAPGYVFGPDRREQSVAFPPLSDRPYPSAPFDPGVTLSSGRKPSLRADGACRVADDGERIVVTGVGSCDVSAGYAGDLDYLPAAPLVRSFGSFEETGGPVVVPPSVAGSSFTNDIGTGQVDCNFATERVNSATWNDSGWMDGPYAGPYTSSMTVSGNQITETITIHGIAGTVTATLTSNAGMRCFMGRDVEDGFDFGDQVVMNGGDQLSMAWTATIRNASGVFRQTGIASLRLSGASGPGCCTNIAGFHSRNLSTATSGVQLVSLNDRVSPQVTAPADIAVDADAAEGKVVTFTATASDAADGALTPACVPASGTRFAVGATTVRCTARDSAGNEGTDSFEVRVRDTTKPVLSLPSAPIVRGTDAVEGRTVAYTVSATDFTDGPVEVTCDRSSLGYVFPHGTTPVTCSAHDAAGNVATGSFDVTITTSDASMAFDGSAYVTAPRGPVLDVRDDFTIESAVRWDGGSGDQVVVSLPGSDAGVRGIALLLRDGRPCLVVRAAGADRTACGSTAIPTGSWVVVRGTYDGSTVQIAVDGLVVDAVTGPHAPVDAAPLGAADGLLGPPLLLGREFSGNAATAFRGRLDDVRIARGLPGTDQTTVASYRFDEGGGETVYDSSAYGHDGTVVGTGAAWTAATEPGAPVIAFLHPGDMPLRDGPLSVQASVSPAQPLTLRAAGACTASGVVVTPTAVGSCVLTAVSAGAQPVARTLMVTRDPTPPVISVPDDAVREEAFGPSGADVTFDVSAADALDGPRPVTCAPASGSRFAIGVHVVSCRADDRDGNVATRDFAVEVVDSPAPSTPPSTEPTDGTVPVGEDVGGLGTSSACAPGRVMTGARVDTTDGSVASASALCTRLATVTTAAGDAIARPDGDAVAAAPAAGTTEATDHADLRCPAGQVVTSIAGRYGAWTHALRLQCRALTGVATPSGATTDTEQAGGAGGDAFGPNACPASAPIAVALTGEVDEWLERPALRCAAVTAGRPDHALHFLGGTEGSRVSVPDSDAFDLGSSGSVAARVRWDGSLGYRGIVSKLQRDDEGTALSGWALAVDDGRPCLAITTIHNSMLCAPDRLDAGRWTHLRATYDDGRIAIEVDGEEVAAAPIPGGPVRTDASQGASTPLLIGHDAAGDRAFTGEIDDVRLQVPARGATQALYRFDEGQGDVLHDSSGAGRDGARSAVVPPQWTYSTEGLRQSIGFPQPPPSTYGETVAPGATASSALPVSYAASGACELDGDALRMTDVGTCSVTARQAGNDLYRIAPPVTRSFAVEPRPLAVRADDQRMIAGGDMPALSASYSGFAFEDDQSDLDGRLELATTATEDSLVGMYPLVASGLASERYAITFVPGTLTIAPTPEPDDRHEQSVSFDAPTAATYGDAPLTLPSANATSEHPIRWSSDGPCSIAGEEVVLHHAGTCSLTATQRGDVAWKPASLTRAIAIAPKALTVRARDARITYGTARPHFESTATGFVNGDDPGDLAGTPQFTTGAGATPLAGTYRVVPAGFTSPDYAISYEPGTLTVDRQPLVAQAHDASRVYGDSNGALAVTLTGLVADDRITATGVSAASQRTRVGDYSILPDLSDPDGRLANYDVDRRNGTLTVTPAKLVAAVDEGPWSRLYGRANPHFTGRLTGVVDGDDISAAWVTAARERTPVGTYAVVPDLTDPAGRLANYDVERRNANLAIERAPLSVVADHKERRYGDSNPDLTGALTGVVDGDDIAAVYATDADVRSGVGTYAIAADVSDPDDRLGNYDVTRTGAKLTVVRRPLEARADDVRWRYGDPRPALTGTLHGVANDDAVGHRYTTDADATSLPGNYHVFAALTGSDEVLANYDVTETGATLVVFDGYAPKLTVSPDQVLEATGPEGARATWTAGAVDDVDRDPAPQVTCDPASGTTFAVGTRTVSCSAADRAGNEATETFTVIVRDTTAPALTVPAGVAVDATGPDGALVPFTVSSRDIVSGERPVACSRRDGSPVASGDRFAIGDTEVTCRSTDTYENTATARFTVHVRSAAEQADGLRALITRLGLPTKLADQFYKKADPVIAAFAAPDGKPCSALNTFDNHVGAKESKAAGLTDDQARQLLEATALIRAAMGGCPK